ncbi:MAG: Flp pilus assembly complex ATPase component TadA [Bacteroidetes bacterium]|nr:Flp pilus assembly complex ATPase component TadA [Bacteroidota bacterium]
MKQVSVNEKAGITFSSAIKSFLRQDPDIILIGEIRDEETALLAIRAAQTGHLLLSSLHTNNAIGSIARLRDLGVANYLLASTLSCVIAQRLVRKLCPMCKVKIKISPKKEKELGLNGNIIYKKKGCESCFDTGYRGRIAVAEILELSNKMRSLIEEGKSTMYLENQMIDEGVLTLKQSISDLIQAGITDDEEFYRVSYD